MFNIQLVSIETIRPSSPTPHNLRHLQLSLLDQLAPEIHVPFTQFYSGNGNHGISRRLKKSLSELLTCFYPLAGRIREDDASGYLHVECNDEGTDFYEVRVDCRLNEFLKQPSIEELIQISSCAVSKDVPFVIQLSVFECGGLAIGCFLSHKIFDGYSAAMMWKAWGDATRGGGDALKQMSPKFDFASLFPPRAMTHQLEQISTVPEKVVMQQFHFEASSIELLREKAKSQAGFSPTSVEALSAFIWRCSMRARGEAGLQRKPVAAHAVDIRKRMDPRLPKYSFGNLCIPVFAISDQTIADCLSDRMGYLEGLLRESVEKIKGEHIREVLENDGEMFISESTWKLFPEEWEKHGFDFCAFSSWITFPLNETDFGWGKPESSSWGTNALKNTTILFPSSNGGVESWVGMIEEDMTRFQQDPELLAFASINPKTCYKEKLIPLLEAKL